MDWCFRWSKGWIRKEKQRGWEAGWHQEGVSERKTFLDFEGWWKNKAKVFDSAAVWGEYYCTVKVDTNSQIADIHTPQHVERKETSKLQYIIGQFTSRLQRQHIILQNRSKSSQLNTHTRTYVDMCKSIFTHVCIFTHVLDPFTFLPTFFSLIYMVCVWLLSRLGSLVEELGNGPFVSYSRAEAEQHIPGFERSIDE